MEEYETSLECNVWRFLDDKDERFEGRSLKTHPLNYGFMLQAGGRWNLQGKMACLYTAFSKRGALGEYSKACWRNPEYEYRDIALAKMNVAVSPVLDLRTKEGREEYNIHRPTMISNRDPDMEKCRAVGYLASFDYVGISAPSAALEGEETLMIFRGNPTHEIELEYTGERKLITEEMIEEHDAEYDPTYNE